MAIPASQTAAKAKAHFDQCQGAKYMPAANPAKRNGEKRMTGTAMKDQMEFAIEANETAQRTLIPAPASATIAIAPQKRGLLRKRKMVNTTGPMAMKPNAARNRRKSPKAYMPP